MKILFSALVEVFARFGDLREANLYTGGTFSLIKAEYNGEIYTVTISKEENDGNDKD